MLAGLIHCGRACCQHKAAQVERRAAYEGTPMNEARYSGPVIDRDSAATLMEPLTELVVRAGAAILSLNRAAMKVVGKPDGSPVTEADLGSDRIIAEGLAWLIPDVP